MIVDAKNPVAHLLDAYLDGERVQGVVEADTAKGYVKCHAVDENGAVIREGDGLKTEVRTGRVDLSITIDGEDFALVPLDDHLARVRERLTGVNTR